MSMTGLILTHSVKKCSNLIPGIKKKADKSPTEIRCQF